MLYVGAAIIIGLLVGFVALAILWLAKSVNESIGRKTMNLVSEYDQLLEQKSRELLKSQAREYTSQRTETTKEIVFSMGTVEQAPTGIINAAQRMSNTVYRDASVGEIYRKIHEGFACNTKEIFADLGIKDEVVEEGLATRLLQHISYNQIYELCTLPGKMQYEVLKETIPEEFFVLLKDFQKNDDNFDSLDFYNYLKELVELEPKKTVIHVAKGANTSDFPSGMVVVEDYDICEGIQIEKSNTLYDFCIKTREIG
ncbi:hypothetical protein [Chakrabartyella piscis]|uniref:hypothetical protein n=1 Tax=Chakrabartyella piscis TaxID=2918914 RepID=UPI002958C80A|nr:hypothetical protein [Chakrabartyella piscis]